MASMATLSLDLRERILSAYDNGEGTRDQIARRFCVSEGMVKKLNQQRRHLGDIRPQHHRSGRKPKILAAHRRDSGIRAAMRMAHSWIVAAKRPRTPTHHGGSFGAVLNPFAGRVMEPTKAGSPCRRGPGSRDQSQSRVPHLPQLRGFPRIRKMPLATKMRTVSATTPIAAQACQSVSGALSMGRRSRKAKKAGGLIDHERGERGEGHHEEELAHRPFP